MVFVNSIAHILHRAVQTNRGRPNKNIGESFLNVPRPLRPPARSPTADACTLCCLGSLAVKSR
eukprot:3649633-Rhodomonas_salina.1